MNDLIKIVINPDYNFSIIRESLSRIGIMDKKKHILYPSVYLYRENDDLYLAHFKEIYAQREKGYSNLSEDDILRRNSIIYCLYNWGMIDVDLELINPHDKFINVLPYKDKSEWVINHKIKIRYKD